MPRVSEEAASFGFAPIADEFTETLVLGSLPSRLSLKTGHYYGNPRNAFWPLMAALLQFDPALPYEEKTVALRRARIGLWDVLRSSRRPGSLDANIDLASARPNDFQAFVDKHTGLQRICFNGSKAAQLFDRFDCLPASKTLATIERLRLPSTSPAHAAMTFAEKCRRWSVVIGTAKALR